MRDVARQHLPGWAGGERGASDQRARATDSRLGTRLSAESVLAASKARRRWGRSGGGRRAAVPGVASGGASRWRERSVRRVRRVGGGLAAACAWRGERARVLAAAAREQSRTRWRRAEALQRPSWRQDHFDAEMLEASLREQRQPVSAEQARQALDALPASTQGAVQSLVADHGPRARQHLAYQALGEWTPDQREAIRTLAAASPRFGPRRSPMAAGRRRDSARAPTRSQRLLGRAPRRPCPRQPGARWERRERDASAQAAGPAAAGSWGWLVNPAPAHLEAKLRFGWDFTVGQIAAMVGGILIGFAWANWLSPIHGIGAAVTGVYVGGLPVAAGFIASQTEFDLGAVVVSAVRWRRADGRFVAGAGAAPGTVVAEHDRGAGEAEPLAVLDPELLWGSP